ncbi:unnamed protein product [Rotaria sp. Silwood1]|nr:unnamed protein product [Rotaria sp. Silwood1]
MSCIYIFYDSSEVPEGSSADIGTSQSPIDIKLAETVAHEFSPFKFSPDHDNEITLTLKDDGHQVSAVLPEASESEKEPELWFTGSDLTGKFSFVNFHLHWGTSNHDGSEHTFHGHTFPGEAHVVYKNLETEEIAVLGFFFHVVHSPDEENRQWKKYAHIASLLQKGDTMNCTFNLSQLMQIETKHFVRYMGSLTTPPYTEGIIWTVFIDSVPILDDCLHLLRYNVMDETYREVQPINDRVIYKNYTD